jgi:hypothetical protein
MSSTAKTSGSAFGQPSTTIADRCDRDFRIGFEKDVHVGCFARGRDHNALIHAGTGVGKPACSEHLTVRLRKSVRPQRKNLFQITVVLSIAIAARNQSTTTSMCWAPAKNGQERSGSKNETVSATKDAVAAAGTVSGAQYIYAQLRASCSDGI